MSDRPVQRFGTVTIVGGGCYGSFYVRQLDRAVRAGAARIDRLVVVDHDPRCAVALGDAGATKLHPLMRVSDWASHFDEYLSAAAAEPGAVARDAIVPSPLMPHLLFDWLAARVRRRWPGRNVATAPLAGDLPVPWQRAGADGTHYGSFATWMCPINCVEPARCPHTRGPRDWTMPIALRRYAGARETAAPPAGPYVFQCTHRAYGVGMIDVPDVVSADADLAAKAGSGAVDALVGTVSHCHGAVSRLLIGALAPPTHPHAPGSRPYAGQ